MLFHRHYSAIHAFAYRLSLSRADADDIAQATFVQAARALGSFRGDASFKNWLYTIAANRSRDFHRQRVRKARLSDELAVLAAVEDGPGEPDEAHEEVRLALAKLSADQRAAVALVYYEGLNHAEAARTLECAESTVSWRIFRAKQKLKHLLRAGCAPARHD